MAPTNPDALAPHSIRRTAANPLGKPAASPSGRPGFLGPKDDKKDKDDSGSDPWDIPTFLRKRKK